ncbi:MAG TPA: FecR domain-containing protein [Rhizomicrobium sp.]|nr:FecR domain-containing protein [Rhizomicrobium sp.]
MSNTRAAEIRAAASLWVARKDGTNWDAETQSAFDSWLAQSDAHMVAYLRADAAWKRADKLIVLRPTRARRIAETLKDALPVIRRVAVAGVVLAVIGFATVDYLNTPPGKLYTTPVGGRETITLVDGSQIALNTDTALRLDLSGKDRKVWLDKGEAYFHVTHNAQRPFRVYAGERTVTDLGTKFSVRREPARFEVAVMEGKVAFDAGKAANRKPIDMTPGDVLVATATTLSLTRKPPRALAESLGWQRGLLIFDNTTLADAVAQFNRYNGEKLTVAKSAGHLPVVGTFRTNDAEAFARVIAQVFGLHTAKTGNTIVIKQ